MLLLKLILKTIGLIFSLLGLNYISIIFSIPVSFFMLSIITESNPLSYFYALWWIINEAYYAIRVIIAVFFVLIWLLWIFIKSLFFTLPDSGIDIIDSSDDFYDDDDHKKPSWRRRWRDFTTGKGYRSYKTPSISQNIPPSNIEGAANNMSNSTTSSGEIPMGEFSNNVVEDSNSTSYVTASSSSSGDETVISDPSSLNKASPIILDPVQREMAFNRLLQQASESPTPPVLGAFVFHQPPAVLPITNEVLDFTELALSEAEQNQVNTDRLLAAQETMMEKEGLETEEALQNLEMPSSEKLQESMEKDLNKNEEELIKTQIALKDLHIEYLKEKIEIRKKDLSDFEQLSLLKDLKIEYLKKKQLILLHGVSSEQKVVLNEKETFLEIFTKKVKDFFKMQMEAKNKKTAIDLKYEEFLWKTKILNQNAENEAKVILENALKANIPKAIAEQQAEKLIKTNKLCTESMEREFNNLYQENIIEKEKVKAAGKELSRQNPSLFQELKKQFFKDKKFGILLIFIPSSIKYFKLEFSWNNLLLFITVLTLILTFYKWYFGAALLSNYLPIITEVLQGIKEWIKTKWC